MRFNAPLVSRIVLDKFEAPIFLFVVEGVGRCFGESCDDDTFSHSADVVYACILKMIGRSRSGDGF